MNEINKQVVRARRRLILGNFFSILTWSVFVGLILAVIGLTIPKIWHLEFLQARSNLDTWTFAWIAGGCAVGLLTACVMTWLNRASHLDVAVEVDKRFGLKERLSSAMALDADAANSGAGLALLADAQHRAEAIDVRDQFQLRPSWRLLLPLIPVAFLILLLFVPNAEKKAVAVEPEKIDRAQLKVAIKEIKEQVKKSQEQLAAKGLKDANQNLKSLEKKFDDLLDNETSEKKETLVKLNDIKKQIADRQKELGDSKELKESLNRLKDVSEGPAKKLSDAMSKGDMEEARKAIKELADKLKAGDLNKIEMKKLAKDLEQMAKELQKIADKHEQEKQQLKEEIKKALDEGDLDKAAQMQQKLEEKEALDKQKDKMKKMAENLQKCANCMKPGGNGDPKQGKDGQSQKSQPGQNSEQQAQAQKEAGQSLEDLADQLQEMQDQLEEMDTLQDLEKMAEGCKNAMNQGGKPGEPKWQDWAKGKGPGGGKRGLEKEDTGSFRAQVKGKLQQGETVVTGNADGKNITGRSASETRELIQASIAKDSDPLENQKLPRTKREQAQQYFESLRDNQ